MVYFLLSGWKFDFGATIDYRGVSSKPESGPGGIHGDVSASHHAALLSGMDRSEVILPEGLHQVVTGQELIGGEDSVEVLAGDTHELGQSRTCSHEDRLETFVVDQAVYGHGASDDHIGFNLDTQSFNCVDLAFEHFVLGKPEFRDSVHKHAAYLMESFEDRDVVAPLCQIRRAGESGGTGSDHGYLFQG